MAFGSTHGSPTVQREIYEHFFSGSEERFSAIGAVDYLKSMVHTTAVNITKMFEIKGRVISSSTACTTSSQSIGYGYEAVKYGMQDAMVCGGADEYDTTTVAVFDNLLACSTEYNDTPHLTPRPSIRSATDWWWVKGPVPFCWKSTNSPENGARPFWEKSSDSGAAITAGI